MGAQAYDGAMLLADTSVWTNIRKKAAPLDSLEEFLAAITNGQIRTSPVVRLEMTWGARTVDEATRKAHALTTVVECPLTPNIIDRAIAALDKMVGQLPDPPRVPIPDALIAATAQAHGLGVLHYDKHFEQLAAGFGIPARWVTPRGTI